MIVTFFRDILDGPLYTIVCVVSSILICSCIGYLAEQHELKKKKQKEEPVEVLNNQNEKSISDTVSNNSEPVKNNNTVATNISVQQPSAQKPLPRVPSPAPQTLNYVGANDQLSQSIPDSPPQDILSVPQGIPEQVPNAGVVQSSVGTIPYVGPSNINVSVPQSQNSGINNSNNILG